MDKFCIYTHASMAAYTTKNVQNFQFSTKSMLHDKPKVMYYNMNFYTIHESRGPFLLQDSTGRFSVLIVFTL